MPFVQSYTNIFGGNQINVVFPSYIAYSLTANITLNWATSFVDNSNVVANIMDFTQNAGGYVVTLPNATLVSNGQVITINNPGANTFTINANDGSFLLTVGVGLSYQLYLRNNSTQAGTWGITQNGAGTTQAQANQLVGANSGLTVINGLINTNLPNKTLNANYTILASDRANLLVWTGGTGTLTLPTVASIANGYFVAINNQGGGNITITTSDTSTIDGNANLTLKPGQSAFIDAQNPANLAWNTIGLGQNSLFAYTAVNVNVAGNTNVVLTNQQAANQLITFSGALTGNITVTFPSTTGVWYVFNNTSGLFTLTAVLNGNNIILPQSEKLILYSDGTNFYSTPTIATSVVFNDGNAANPSIAFASDPTSGFYKVGSGTMGYSSLGSNALSLGALSGGQTGLAIASGDVLRLVGTNAGNYATLKAGNMAASVNWTWPTADAANANGILQSNAAGTLSFSTASYPATTVADQILYSSATNTVTGLATANNATLITSAGGVPSISQTLPTAVQANITTLGTIGTGVWNGTPVTVQFGGTGLATFTTDYGVVCAGTTPTGNLQNAGAGTINQVFTSNGAAALPSWKAITIALPAAVKADQITGTSTSVYVNPAVQQYHLSAIKAWVVFNGSTLVINDSYNIASVTSADNINFAITFTTAFSTNNYGFSGIGASGGVPSYVTLGASGVTTSVCNITMRDVLGNPSVNVPYITIQFFGRQ